MKIEYHHTNEDGELSIVVDQKKYDRIVKHLKSKGVRTGGHDSQTTFNEVTVDVSIDKVNEALKDFVE